LDTFSVEANLNIYSQCPEISFNHKKSYENPTDHLLKISDSCELYAFVSCEGEAHYIIEDHSYSLERGDFIIMKPNEVQQIVLSSASCYERFYILFPDNAFSYIKDELRSPMDCFLKRQSGRKNKICLKNEDREKSLSLLYSISTILSNEKQDKIILAYSYLLELLTIINDSFNQNDDAMHPSYLIERPKLISDILIYIHHNLYEIDSASHIANKFYISLPYLSSMFKTHMKISLTHYLQAIRISRAKILLEEGHSITDTCFTCGFNDNSYFIKIFKKYVGTTPLKYKNNAIT
jgi:AraC-like DNA-binding protein